MEKFQNMATVGCIFNIIILYNTISYSVTSTAYIVTNFFNKSITINY